MEKENDCGAGESHRRVAPIAKRLRRRRSDQKIASNSAGQCRRESQHHYTKKIEVAVHGSGGSLDREQKSSGEIGDCQKPIGPNLYRLRAVRSLRHRAFISPQSSSSFISGQPGDYFRWKRARFHSFGILRIEAGPNARFDAFDGKNSILEILMT